MDFRIADTFTDSLTKLTGSEQKGVKTTAFDLQLNPAQPGLRLHKLDRVRDPNFWSVRVSRDVRMIVHRTQNSLMLCYVDHHDNAYQWAERRKLETHPKTGAAQLVELRETVQAGISFLAFQRLKIYTHLRPSEYNVFSERTISSERPFRGPLKPSNQHPNPAFSDNSPYLGDSGIVFLCAVAQAIPTGVPIHRSAPACWQTAVGSNGPRPAGASSTVRVLRAVLRFSPAAAGGSSRTTSRFSVAALAVAIGCPGCRR